MVDSAAAMAESDSELRGRLADLLTKGCDDRIIVNPATGMHKYNGTNVPVPGSVRRSSCTFSVPTEDAFAAGLEALAMVEKSPLQIEVLRQAICQKLASIWSAPGAALTMFPSGTDAEFLPMLVGLARALRLGGKLVSIVTCAGEVGSGSKEASIGRHFSTHLPKPHMWSEQHAPGESIFAKDSDPGIDAVELKLRHPDGGRKQMAALDQEVKEAVAKALSDDGYAVALVHMVVGSKTGHLMPSQECMRELVEAYGERVVPLADACQVRMVDNGLHSLVEGGFAVLATGSKFYGGPPFSGVALLPAAMVAELNEAFAPDAPANLRGKVESSSLRAYISGALVPPELSGLKEALPTDSLNLGLLMRWHMALYHIEKYHGIPEQTRHKLEAKWMTETKAMISEKKLSTVCVAEDESVGATPLMKRQGTLQSMTQAGMLPDETIILLDLKKADADGAMKRCSLGEMKRIHNLMARDLSDAPGLPDAKNPVWARRCFLAQPVALSADYCIIRAAIGAPLVLRLHAGLDVDELRQEDSEWVEKLNLILTSWAALPA